MKLADLQPDEQLVLGGLIRLMIRSDGDFSEAEEEVVNQLSLKLGDEGCLWKVISSSAQAHPQDAAIRDAASAVTRAESRALIRDVLGQIAAGDGVASAEDDLLQWLTERWS